MDPLLQKEFDREAHKFPPMVREQVRQILERQVWDEETMDWKDPLEGAEA